MKLAAIRNAIEKLLGQPVSYASVEWCIRMGVGAKGPSVVPVALGFYRLI